MKKTLTLCLLVALSLFVNAQKTVALQPGAEGKDALLYWIESVYGINGDMMNKNYGNSNAIFGEAWTIDGNFFIARSLLEFDYSVIPAGSKIISAKLSLFFEGTYEFEHSSLSGSNELVIQRVTSPWEENSVTWNTQPPTTTKNQLTVPQTTSSYQDLLNFDVTALVKDSTGNLYPNNYGFLIRLAKEEYYRRCGRYSSSDNAMNTKHPKLEITYEEPFVCHETVYDTVLVNVYDTIHINVFDTVSVKVNVYDTIFQYTSVTDTLVIDAWFTGNKLIDAPATIKMYPNPTNRDLNISIPDFSKLSGYSIKIIDNTGKVAFASYVDKKDFVINFDQFGPRGLYLVQIIDNNYKVVDVRKIQLK